MRQKKNQDYPYHVNFDVNITQQKYNQSDNIQNMHKQRGQQSQQESIQYQNESIPNTQSYWKGSEVQTNVVSSSSLMSYPSIADSQLQLGAPKSGTLQGRKIDSQTQAQIVARSSNNIQPKIFTGEQLQLQDNGFYNRNIDNINYIHHVQFQNNQQYIQSQIKQGLSQTQKVLPFYNQQQKIQLYNNQQHFNGIQGQTVNSSSISFYKKNAISTEQPAELITNENIKIRDEAIQNVQKKKRLISSMNQFQLKTIYEDIKKIERKPRSSSNTPSKERKSRSASKKRSLEKSSKKLSQTLQLNNPINNKENQELEDIQINNPLYKIEGAILRRKKKSSNSVHIKPVSKQSQNLLSQQHSASKSRSPSRGKKKSQINGFQRHVLGEKDNNSPMRDNDNVIPQKKSPSQDERQKKKKKSSSSNNSKPKSKTKLSHAKSTSQLLQSISQQQLSHDQSKQNISNTQHQKEVDNFIKKNAQKIQFEQLIKKQEEIEEKNKTKQEEEKRKFQNELIRKENMNKFCKIKKAITNDNSEQQLNINLNNQHLQQKYAWGTNQQRIKMHQIIQSQQSQQHQQSIEKSSFNNTYVFQKSQFPFSEEEILIQQHEKEKKRREKSGLSFLNNLNESFIQKKIEFEKIKQEQMASNNLTEDNKKKLTAPLNHEEIKKFMILKQKKIQNEAKKRLEEQKERQERLKNNLNVLDQEIKNQRSNNSCWVQGSQQEKDKIQGVNGASTHQRSKSATQRKKKNRTVSTPNLEKYFNKSQSQIQLNSLGESLLKKEFSQKQIAQIKNSQQYQQQNGTQEEDDAFLINNYFSNTQQQYSKKYEPSGYSRNSYHQSNSNNNDAYEENFEMLNKEFKKMFNITGSYIDDKNLMEFSESINKTQQMTTTGQTNNGSNRLGSSSKKSKKKEVDFMKPKSMSMHASSSVGNFKAGQGFDSSHYGHVNSIQSHSQKLKETSKEGHSKKNTRKSQATSISPEPKTLKKSASNQIKSTQQNNLNHTGSNYVDNNYKNLQQAHKIVGFQQQNAQFIKDKNLQDSIKQKKDELKQMYSQINSRVNSIKHQSNANDQNNNPQYNNVSQDEQEDQLKYGSQYYNQPLNNKKIQQVLQGNSQNSIGSINSSQRRVHISNASPIQEEPEEEDKGHFSNYEKISNNPFHPQNQKQGMNYINNFQQIFQNSKRDVMNSESSNNTNYPQKVNSNPYSNESDSNRPFDTKKDQNNQVSKKKSQIKENIIQITTQQKAQQVPQQIEVNVLVNPLSSLSKISPPSKSKQTSSVSMSIGIAEQKINDNVSQQYDINIGTQNQTALHPQFTTPKQEAFIQNYGSQIQDNQNIIQDNSSQMQVADPNAPISIYFKETIQSKSYLSSINDNRNSQLQQDIDIRSDADNQMTTPKEQHQQQDEDNVILPTNINFQYRVQQMKKRTHNTDNDDQSSESSSRNKLPLPTGVIQTVVQIQREENNINLKLQNNLQVQGGQMLTSKTPQSTNREENNKSNNSAIPNQNLEKDYQNFQKEEDIKLELIKEIETQNQMSSRYFEQSEEHQENKQSQFYQIKTENTSNLQNNYEIQQNNQQQQPQQNEDNLYIPNNEQDQGEEIDVDYLYDLDYEQLEELKMIVFQGDPENPEIQALSEQLILYDAAATIIQKVFRGFYTQFQRQQDEEEERLYQEAEKYLEENQIEPEELLEGNPVPLNMQQNNLPYHPSDQLKELESIEQTVTNNKSHPQFNKSQQEYSKNEISESNFPIKIQDYKNQMLSQDQHNKSPENNTFFRDSQAGENLLLSSSPMPQQSGNIDPYNQKNYNKEFLSSNKDLYHQKNYNDDLLQPKQSDFMPDFDFNDPSSEKITKNSQDIYNHNIISGNIYVNQIPPFLPQSLQNQAIDNSVNSNPSNQYLGIKTKFVNSAKGSNSESYREQSKQYNQLNLKEINEQSKSLVTVKDFDSISKDKNKAVADSQISQQIQMGGKSLISPQSDSNLQTEISKLQEQAKIWNQMITQIVQLPQDQSQQFKENALKILNNLQKQSEMSKQMLIENIKLNQQIPKSPNISTDRFPLSEQDYLNDKQYQSNCDSQQDKESSKEFVSGSSSNANIIRIPQNQQSSSNITSGNLNQLSSKDWSQQMDKKMQANFGANSKKNLQLDIDKIESNYNEKIQSRQQKKEQFPKIGNEYKQNLNYSDQKIDGEKKKMHTDNEPTISQEQRAIVRALSVSSVESNELRYANIISNNSSGTHLNKGKQKAKQNIIDRLNNDPIFNSNSNKDSHQGSESVSSVGSSFFDKQPFKEFTTKILQKFTMPQQSVEDLIKTREEAIEYKHKTQMDLIKKMHERNRISPKSLERKQFELEKWVSNEKENLKNVKKEIERGWEQFEQTIKQTKRDIEFMEQTKRIDTSKLLQSSEEDQLRRLLSMKSESEHSIEDIGAVDRKSLEGIYQFRIPNIIEDPNKIKIVDTYKPADQSTLSATSSQNRNRNNSENLNQSLSARSRNISLPQIIGKDEQVQQKEISDIIENNFSKYNPRYLNVGLSLQIAQQNQQSIYKDQQDLEDLKEENPYYNTENKLILTQDKKNNKIQSNASSVHDGEEEIEQFLTAEKDKSDENIQIGQRKVFDAYGYCSDDFQDDEHGKYYPTQKKNQNDNKLEIYIDNDSEHCDRLDVSPIFTISSASKQGTQDKESLKFLMSHNNQNHDSGSALKVESDAKNKSKKNSQDSKTSDSQASSISESTKNNQENFQTIDYDDDITTKKVSKISQNVSPKLNFMRGDFMQEEQLDIKIKYISDKSSNLLTEDSSKDQSIKFSNDKSIRENQQANTDQMPQAKVISLNFMEPMKIRQNVYNIDDFHDESDRTTCLETSSGMPKGQSSIQNLNRLNQTNTQEDEQSLKQNQQKNPFPSPQNSPTSKESQMKNINALPRAKPMENNFLQELNEKKDNQQIDQKREPLKLLEEKILKFNTEDLDYTQNTQSSQQQQQVSEQILTTQNNLPGLECATLNFIKDYLVSFSEFIKDNFTDDFLDRVNIPLGMDPVEFLKTFTITENIDNNNGEASAAPIYPIVKYIHMQRPVVSEELFAHFNEIFNRERDITVMTDDLLELERYHMRMIFDCFNEALDSMRPFGLRGKPLPWKINSNKLSSIMITPDNIEKILGLAIAKVLKWGSFLCGFIPERIESPTGEIVQIEDDYLNQIKEDRLAQMLENEVVENEDKWLSYEDEETDVQLEISEDIFNFLVDEVAQVLYDKQNGQSINEGGSPNAFIDSNKGETIINNFEGLSKNIFGNPNLKPNKKQGQGGGIRPTNDLGISQQIEQEKKQMQKEMFLKNLQMGNFQAQQSQKDALNSSF